MTKLIVTFSNFTKVPNKRRTSIPSVGFETAIAAFERLQAYALDRMATGAGLKVHCCSQKSPSLDPWQSLKNAAYARAIFLWLRFDIIRWSVMICAQSTLRSKSCWCCVSSYDKVSEHRHVSKMHTFSLVKAGGTHSSRCYLSVQTSMRDTVSSYAWQSRSAATATSPSPTKSVQSRPCIAGAQNIAERKSPKMFFIICGLVK